MTGRPELCVCVCILGPAPTFILRFADSTHSEQFGEIEKETSQTEAKRSAPSLASNQLCHPRASVSSA